MEISLFQKRLRKIENKVLRNMFEAKRGEITGVWKKNCIMLKNMHYIFTWHARGDQESWKT